MNLYLYLEILNREFLLKIKFKSRNLRLSVLKKKYGNEDKFTYFNTIKVLKVFKYPQRLNLKYHSLKINFLKKDITFN